MNLRQTVYKFISKSLKILQGFSDGLIFSKKSFFTAKNTLLILRLDSIGDYIIFRNFIEIIRTSNKYKNYKITLCGNFWWKNLAENLDRTFVDEFIWVDYNQISTNLNDKRQLIRKIYSKGFETLIHPTYSRDLLGDELVKLSGAKYKIGYSGDTTNLTINQKNKNDLNYTTLITHPEKFQFEFYRNLYFIEKLLNTAITLNKPFIHCTKSNVQENKIIFCPGAKVPFRRWEPKKFAELSDKLISNFPGSEFVLCGAESDNTTSQEIISNSTVRFSNYTGQLNLIELTKLFSQAQLIITNDSGPFHLAVALNKRVVCISNGNNYGRFTPYPEKMQTWSKVVYPSELASINSEAERLNQYCKEGSMLDINSISVSMVYDTVKLVLKSA